MSWPDFKLGSICTLNYGKSLRDYHDNSPENSPVRVFGTNGPIGWTQGPLTETPTIVVGRKGAYRGVHYSEGPSWTIDTAYFLTLECEEVDLKWLYYRLLLLDINRMDTGAAIPSTKREDFYAASIKLPSLGEQRRIASVLAAIDDLIENNRRRIALLEDAARQLYREWFVRFRFPGHEHVKIVDGVPDGWERQTLGDLLTLQRGFDLPVADRNDGLVPVYGSTGIVGFHDIAKVQAPMIVTGRSGSLGQVCFVSVPCWPLNTALWVRDFKRVSPWFAYFLLSELGLEKFNGGASVPTLDRKVAHAASVLLPRSALLETFDEIIQEAFKLTGNLQRQIVELAKARDLLLPRLMNGSLAA